MKGLGDLLVPTYGLMLRCVARSSLKPALWLEGVAVERVEAAQRDLL